MTGTTRNPYTPMLMAFNPDYFYGRENEVISILQMITALEPNGHAIYGLRSIGKTTLLRFLKAEDGALRRYEDFVGIDYRHGGTHRLIFVYISFHDFREGDELFRVILHLTGEELQNDVLAGEIHVPLAESVDTRQDLLNSLRRVLQQLGEYGVRVVYLMDDFDIPLRYIDEDDDRLLRNLADEAALILVTETPISELNPDIGEDSPLIGILRPESLGLLKDDSARRLIREPLEKVNQHISDQEMNFLIQVAGRQPFLLLASCEEYFNMRSEYPEFVSMLDSEDGINSLTTQFVHRLTGQGHIAAHMRRTWNRLEDFEKQILEELAANGIIKTNHPQAHSAAQLANKALVYLNVKRGGYQIFSQFFASFIAEVAIPATLKTQQARATTARPTDSNLTPIDQSLLEYFIAHADQTCTFDELLNAVWEDSDKSKRALEAAVFRLRKHLHDGEQIKNIWGKGYKYSTS